MVYKISWHGKITNQLWPVISSCMIFQVHFMSHSHYISLIPAIAELLFGYLSILFCNGLDSLHCMTDNKKHIFIRTFLYQQISQVFHTSLTDIALTKNSILLYWNVGFVFQLFSLPIGVSSVQNHPVASSSGQQ